MSFTALRSIDVIGASTTGTKHVLHIEESADELRFTIVGPTGKRHATVVCEDIPAAQSRITDFFKEGQPQ